MGNIWFRNIAVSSLEGVYVSKMPDHKRASKRMAEYYVKGRDGALHVDEGFSNFDIQVTLVLIDAPATARQLVNAWADGTGKLVTSDDQTKAYKATVIDEIRWTRTAAAQFVEEFTQTKAYYVGDLVKHSGQVYKFKVNHSAGAWNASHVDPIYYTVNGLYDTAKITFNCEPFMYEAADSQIEFMQSGELINPGSADALPLLKVEGSGNVSFTFCGEEIGIDSMSANDPVFIDCATGYIYSQSGSAKAMHGEIPKIPLGTSAVTFGSNLTKLTVTPHWRWV